MRRTEWYTKRDQPLAPADEDRVLALIRAVEAAPEFNTQVMERLLRTHTRASGQFAKDVVIATYKRLCAAGRLTHNPETQRRLQMKPTRTVSGVATVTVLTKPFPCPGECIFCPTDVRMPKSYLHDEPGAARAEAHQFDPFATTASRLRALENIGHPTDKVELLILGGTWSFYPPDYQAWFIQRCLDALNGCDSESLAHAQHLNATAARRNVGLVVETRPDYVDAAEIRRLRRYGVTKVQIGIQSLDDHILELNKRGHTVQTTRRALTLLRAAGFKIHAHWMPNLLGATPASDRADFARLWADDSMRPDELKIYPCSLVHEAELVQWWERGEYIPYTDPELMDLLADCVAATPRYVRLNRIIRDIPAGHVVAGSTLSNLRELVDKHLQATGRASVDIRAREVRGHTVRREDLHLRDTVYATAGSVEHFLSFETEAGRLAGFLRLSLPTPSAAALTGLEELGPTTAIIREVHVYGPVVPLGLEARGQAQHLGLGGELLNEAARLARQAGYTRLAVIAALGTREYYRKHGFAPGELYMSQALEAAKAYEP